jgi:predicted DNA-binding transcriptional regulator YafY
MAESAARLLHLLSLLQTRPQWAGGDLAERLGVTERTLRRDVERLRALGYPVAGERGVAGGYRLGAGSALPPLLLDDDEATTVAIALRAVSGVQGLTDTAVSALAKLERVLPGRLRHRITALQQATVALPHWATTSDPDSLAVVAVACRNQHRLRFAYTDHRGAVSTRHAEPHRLVHSGRHWYLVARDVDRDQWRSFRADRIGEPFDTGERFVPLDPPDAAEFVATAVTTKPYRHQARILLHVPIQRAAETFPATSGTLAKAGPDTCVLTIGAHSLDAMVLNLGMLDFGFTVLEPAELADRVRAVADRLRASSPPP